MRTFLFTVFTAVTTAAFTAYLLHTGLPQQRPVTPTAELVESVSGQNDLRTVSGSVTGAPTAQQAPMTLAERLSAAYQGLRPESATAENTAPSTHLLNEPVAILQGAEHSWKEVPAGTAVQLLSTKGAFAQVRIAQNVVTVPRNVLVQGVSRAN